VLSVRCSCPVLFCPDLQAAIRERTAKASEKLAEIERRIRDKERQQQQLQAEAQAHARGGGGGKFAPSPSQRSLYVPEGSPPSLFLPANGQPQGQGQGQGQGERIPRIAILPRPKPSDHDHGQGQGHDSPRQPEAVQRPPVGVNACLVCLFPTACPLAG
jgi:hypothetical protein